MLKKLCLSLSVGTFIFGIGIANTFVNSVIADYQYEEKKKEKQVEKSDEGKDVRKKEETTKVEKDGEKKTTEKKVEKNY